MASILDPENLKGIIILVLLVWFGTGAGFRVLSNLLKKAAKYEG